MRNFHQQSYFQSKTNSLKDMYGLVSGLTLGMVNIHKNGVTFKDPITGPGNMLAKIKDSILNDRKKGVWLGKKEIGGYGFSSYATEVFNANNLLHYAVMIDGKAYHLQKRIFDTIYVSQLKQQDYQNYEWFYKGKVKRSGQQIQKFIQQINSTKINYDRINSNGTDVVKAIQYYVLGSYSQYDALNAIANTGGASPFKRFVLESVNFVKL